MCGSLILRACRSFPWHFIFTVISFSVKMEIEDFISCGLSLYCLVWKTICMVKSDSTTWGLNLLVVKIVEQCVYLRECEHGTMENHPWETISIFPGKWYAQRYAQTYLDCISMLENQPPSDFWSPRCLLAVNLS